MEGGDAGVGRRGERAKDERTAEYGLQQLGLTRAVLESVPITGREDDGVPHRNART